MRSTLVAACAVVLAGVVETASAQPIQNVVLRNSFNPVGAGARGLGMGGAFIAVADDGSAASFNPAGLAQLRRTELTAVGFSYGLDSSLQIPAGNGTFDSRETNTRHSRPEFFGVAIPFELAGRNLTVQLSYQRSVDLFGKGQATVVDTIDLSELDPSLKGTGDFIADVSPTQSGAFNTVSLSAGYQLTSRLAFGTTVNYWFAGWTAQGASSFGFRARLAGGGRPIEIPLSDTTFSQQQSLHGLNVNAGLLLKYSWLSIGGVLRMPFTGSYGLVEDDKVVTYTDGKAGPADRTTLNVTSTLHWPLTAGAGLALRPFRGLTLAADYTHAQWSHAVIANVPAGALLTPRQLAADGTPQDAFFDRNFFDLEAASLTTTHDTSAWRMGGEYLVVLKSLILPLRSGYFRDRSPIAELGSDQGQQITGWTLGSGLNFKHLVLDVAFERQTSSAQLGLRLRRGVEIDTSNVTTENVRQNRIVASLIYRFGGEEDPLKRAFRAIFVGPKEQDDH